MGNETTNAPPLEPYLIPESPASPPAEPAIQPGERIAAVASISSKTRHRKAAVKNRLRRPKAEKFTLEEAFEYGASTAANLDLERAVRAVGFLLHFCSDMGTYEVKGWLAEGLGHVLDFTANELRLELTRLRDVEASLQNKKEADTPQ